MAFKCPVPRCEDSEKEFQTEAALKSHIRNTHSNMKVGARKVLLATAEPVRGKHTDIMKKASYGAYDKLALKQFKAIVTVNLLPPHRPEGNNSSLSSSFLS
jgi:hypothetical protein